jgi:RNA polymerase sigma factor (sigma-70 family)
LCPKKIQNKPDGSPRTWSPTRTCLFSRFSKDCDIDDIIQESFLRVLKAREERSLKSPKAFLFATARNLALDSVRHSSVAKTDYLEQELLSEFEDLGIGVPEAVARNQELEILTKAIQSMPDRCRQVFTLRKVYGMPQREIAKKLNISRNTVSAQMTTGLRKFTQYMETYCTERDRL